jgi:hypothetical protein
MHTRITLLLAAFSLLLGGLLAVASPAAAAPAETYRFDECFEEVEDGDLYTECYQDRGVMHYNETPSGNINTSDNGRFSTQFYINGELIYSASGNFHYTTVIRNGEEQVAITHSRFETTYEGMTCTGSIQFIYTNGEYRRLVTDSQCV